jgi:hypothetical protein
VTEDGKAEWGVAADVIKSILSYVGDFADGVEQRLASSLDFRPPKTCSVGLSSGAYAGRRSTESHKSWLSIQSVMH